MKELLKLLYKRWSSETPAFFKNIIKIGLFCGTLGGGLKIAGDNIPKFVSDKTGYLITIGISSASIAKFTVKDKEIEDKSNDLLHPNI
jgi:ABC-type xylose transport system permease subunit